MNLFSRPRLAVLGAAILFLVSTAPVVDAADSCGGNPVAGDDSAAVTDEPIVIAVLANDTDPDGEALTVSQGVDNCKGDVTFEADGLVKFVPYQKIVGVCFIHYTVTDESGNSSNTATITLQGASADIFSDGFESGHTYAWSSCDPSCI